MSKKTDHSTQQQRTIRKKAEEILASAKPEIEEAAVPDVDTLLHELRVHQIELEMQNEELRQTQVALEQTKAHFIDLYDFAPIGYLTLNFDGIIQELNLTAAKLLGQERNKFIQQRFIKFIPDDYKEVWYRHFQRAKEHCEQAGCELPFTTAPGSTSFYHLNCQCLSVAHPDKLMRITLTDVTERKRMEAKLHEIEAVNLVLLDHAPGGMLILDDQMHIKSIKRSGLLPEHAAVYPLIDRSVNEILCFFWEDDIAARIVQVFKNTLETGDLNKSSGFTETRRDTGLRESYQWETQRVTLPDGNFGVACYYLNITEQKKQEEALRIAGVAFETQEAICITDHNNVIQRVNTAFTRITGYSAEEVVGRNPNFLRSDLYDKALYQVVRSLISQYGVWEGELWGKRKDGEIFPMWLMISGVKNEDGATTHYVAAINDITERKQAEALQRDREDRDRLMLFVEQVPAAIVMVDKNMRYLAVSKRWKMDYRLKGDIRGRSHYDIFPEIPERWKIIHQHALAGESLSATEDRFERKDGIIQFLNWSVAPWFYANGEIGGIMMMSEEITERKRVEQISIAAATFETQDSIAIADANKKILRVNKAFCRVTGFSAEEAASLSFFDSKRHKTDQFMEIWANVFQDGYWRGEIWEKRKSGEPFLMAISITAVTDNQGDITHYVADFIDITERRQLEEKLNELNRDFGAFLENTSDYVYYKGADNRFRFCSNSFAKIVGKEKWRDMVGKSLFDVFPKNRAKAYFETELPVINAGKTLLNQLEPYVDENGHQGWVSTSKWPQFDQKGNFTGIFGISRDVTEQQSIERSLRWSEELNRKILEAFPAHIAVIDSNGRIITVNEAWTRFARKNSSVESKELSIGANYLEVCRHSSAMNDDDAARALIGIESVLGGASEQFSMEYPCDSPQEKRWFLMFVVQLIQNDTTGAVIVHQNITTRKQAEIALRESEARYRHLLENQTEIICRYKPDGTLVYVNEAFCRLFGKAKAELEGQKWQPVVFPEDLPMVLEKLASVSRTNPIVTIENRVIAAKGKVRWVQFVNQTFFDKNNRWVETQTVGRDITERKKYEEELRIAAAAFNAQESIIVTDIKRVILKVNEAFTRITGYKAKEVVGKTPAILGSDLHDKAFYDTILETVAREGYWQGEIWNKRKNGQLFPVLQTITRVADEKGILTHYVGTMVDITVQKQAEKVLLDARNRLENQVATSHEELERIKNETVEINTALSVLLRQRESDKSETRIAFTDEVEATVMPLLKKLKTISAGRLQTIRLIKLIEDNFVQLVQSYGYSGNLASIYQKLTPIETQVAAMIRQGQPTKVIAAGLNIAPGTVSIHRKHIRKKLGLDGKKDNLHIYLMSLTE
ncbi:MAG: PAS domain S-box protein [Methylococcaceae bacterium]|nr:PAS domain S-box protein [Methylococcaceae bacterium]